MIILILKTRDIHSSIIETKQKVLRVYQVVFGRNMIQILHLEKFELNSSQKEIIVILISAIKNKTKVKLLLNKRWETKC
jgi:hypothetical protein